MSRRASRRYLPRSAGRPRAQAEAGWRLWLSRLPEPRASPHTAHPALAAVLEGRTTALRFGEIVDTLLGRRSRRLAESPPACNLVAICRHDDRHLPSGDRLRAVLLSGLWAEHERPRAH